MNHLLSLLILVSSGLHGQVASTGNRQALYSASIVFSGPLGGFTDFIAPTSKVNNLRGKWLVQTCRGKVVRRTQLVRELILIVEIDEYSGEFFSHIGGGESLSPFEYKVGDDWLTLWSYCKLLDTPQLASLKKMIGSKLSERALPNASSVKIAGIACDVRELTVENSKTGNLARIRRWIPRDPKLRQIWGFLKEEGFTRMKSDREWELESRIEVTRIDP